jgi:hypothetical protein
MDYIRAPLIAVMYPQILLKAVLPADKLCHLLHEVTSQESAVGIATGYGLDGRGVGVQVPLGG